MYNYNYSTYLNLKFKNNISGNIVLPGSKSISNRILLLSFLSKKIIIIKKILISNDTLIMINILKKIGIKIFKYKKKNKYIVYKNNFNKIKNNIILYIGNAGTILRPLISILSFLKKKYILYGSYRMHKRPINDLINSLQSINIKINYIKKKFFPPVYLNNKKNNFFYINILGNISSQFLTSLLISSILLKNNKNIIIEIKNNLVSKSYVYITINLMRLFGIIIYEYNNFKLFILKFHQFYSSPNSLNIEGDASSLSYFLTASSIIYSYNIIYEIGKYSIQGDINYINLLYKLNNKIIINKKSLEIIFNNKKIKSINIDCNDIPDIAMTISILLLNNNNINIIYNISNWSFKESNRIEAIYKELLKLNNIVYKNNNYLIIIPLKKNKNNLKIKTYNDHRIAMCFSLISLKKKIKKKNINISNTQCVCKTFPKYFKIFNKNCKKI